MVIDTSALLAILLAEPEADRLVDAIAADATRRVGAPTIVEAAAALMGRKGAQGPVVLDALLQRLSIEVADRDGSADQQREAPAQHHHSRTISDTPCRGRANLSAARPSATSTVDGPGSTASSLAFSICAYCADEGAAGDPIFCQSV